MDDKDLLIINELKKDSRQAVKDIAKRLNLRPSTIHSRITRLRKEAIERFTIKLNNKAVNENFIVFMLVSTDKIIDNNVFNDAHIKEVFGITGEYDLLLKMKFKDVVEFNEFVLKLRETAGIKKTLTMVATADIKEEL